MNFISLLKWHWIDWSAMLHRIEAINSSFVSIITKYTDFSRHRGSIYDITSVNVEARLVEIEKKRKKNWIWKPVKSMLACTMLVIELDVTWNHKLKFRKEKRIRCGCDRRRSRSHLSAKWTSKSETDVNSIVLYDLAFCVSVNRTNDVAVISLVAFV